MNRATAFPAPAALLTAALLLGLLAPALAVAVTLDLGAALGQVGDTVELPVEVIGLGGDTIWSFEMDISWYTSYATCVGVITAGTLSETWLVNHLPGNGTVTVTGAGGMPLSGDGTLIKLQFLLGPSSGSPTISLNSATLNEGFPVPTLVNGTLTITALPTINIYPDNGVLAVGDSLSFSTSGGTPPYVYSTSDPAVADFTGDNWLHALAPGQVRAYSEDGAAIGDTTTGLIEVRAFRLRVGSLAATQGDTILVPVEIDDPTGYSIVSAEFQVSWYYAYAEFLELETAGTLLETAGWSDPLVVPVAGQVTVAGAGAGPLPGPGVLVYLKLVVTNSITMTPSAGIFNEVHPALPIAGTVSVTTLPVLSVNPGTASLVVKDEQLFTVSGSPTPPLTWSVDDPLVADIDPTGLLTALTEGVVRVHVLDALGAEAESGLVTICGMSMPPLSSSIDALETVLVPVNIGLLSDGLDIYSLEASVTYNPASVEFLGVVTTGSMTEGWGSATAGDTGGLVTVAHAGATPLVDCGPALLYLEFRGQPGLGSPYTGVSLAGAIFNEGRPCVMINRGTTCYPSSVDSPARAPMRLWPNHPNPFNPSTTIRFRLDREGEAVVTVYSAQGAAVRRLFRGVVAGGVQQRIRWDGRDDRGRRLPSGLYYYRLQAGTHRLTGKMVMLK